MSVGSRMKERRESLGMTQIQLAGLLGVTKGAIGNYETDANSPKASILYKVFEVLKCDANFLFQDEIRERREYTASPHEMEHLVKKYRLLDQYGKEAVDGVLNAEYRRYEESRARAAIKAQRAGMEVAEDMVYFIVPWYFHPMSAGTGEQAGDESPENLRLIKEPPRGTSFVAPVKGDSMEPTYHDGDRLFIRALDEIEPGQIGVFFMDGQQWVKELGNGVLLSHNPTYPPIPMRNEVKCQGLVLGVCDEGYFE